MRTSLAALVLVLGGCHFVFSHDPRSDAAGADAADAARSEDGVPEVGGREAGPSDGAVRAETAMDLEVTLRDGGAAPDLPAKSDLSVRDSLASDKIGCVATTLYDGDFGAAQGWIYPESGVAEKNGEALYSNPNLGGSVYNVSNPLAVPAGCGLKVEVERAFTNGNLSIRLSLIKCSNFPACAGQTFVSCAISPGTGLGSCPPLPAQTAPTTYQTLRLYRDHNAGGTALAKRLTITTY